MSEKDAMNLDLMLSAECGRREISPIVFECFIDSDSYEASISRLAMVTLTMYLSRWSKLAQIYKLEYDPLKNFSDDYKGFETTTDTKSGESDYFKDSTNDVERTGTDTTDYSKNDKVTYGKVEDRLRTDNLLDSTTRNLTDTTTPATVQNTYGFNSGTANPTSSESGTDTVKGTGTLEVKNTGTQTNKITSSGSDTDVITSNEALIRTSNESGTSSDSVSQLNNGMEASTNVRSSSRIGNIGNHTNQQLIQEEIELWRWSLHRDMLNDMKEFLTIPIY